MDSVRLRSLNRDAIALIRTAYYQEAIHTLAAGIESMRRLLEAAEPHKDESTRQSEEEIPRSFYSTALDHTDRRVEGCHIFCRTFQVTETAGMHEISAVVLFNTALAFHLVGDESCLRKALALYTKVTKVISRSTMNLIVLLMASYANMASIYEAINEVDMKALILDRLLTILRCGGSAYCEGEEVAFFISIGRAHGLYDWFIAASAA